MLIGQQQIYNKAFEKYGRSDVVMWDVLTVHDGEMIKVIFESVNSPWKQGVWLRTDQGLVVNDQLCPSVHLWVDTAAHEVLCACKSKDGLLSVYNIWDSGKGPRSQAHSSGMLLENLSMGRRYHCNDIGFDTQFDKLVFRVERVAQPLLA